MRDRLQTTRALPVDGVESGRVGESRGIARHATGFGKAQLRQHVADEHVVDLASLDLGALNGSLHDLNALENISQPSNSIERSLQASGSPPGRNP